MDIEVYKDVIRTIGQCQSGGYGHVESFMNTLWLYRHELKIGMGCVCWRLKYRGRIYRWSYFLSQPVSLDAFNLDKIMECDHVLDSRREALKPFKFTTEFDLVDTILIPICQAGNNELLFDITGVVIIMGTTKLQIDYDDVLLVSTLLNSRCPSTIGNVYISTAINELVNDNINISELSLKHRHKTLSKALEIISGDDSLNIHTHGLLHFSFWSIDNFGKIFASKEFNKNVRGDFSHNDTVNFLDSGSHYVYQYATKLMEESNKDKLIEDLIEIYTYNDIKDSIIDHTYFSRIGFSQNSGMVIVVPIIFETYKSVCCFYVNDIVYTPFISFTLLRMLSDAIKQRINLVNEINIKNMLSIMMTEAIISNHQQYYLEVVETLKQGNEAGDCLVYLRNEPNDQYLLVTEEDETNVSTLKEPNVNTDKFKFWLPDKYANDTFFMNYLRSVLTDKLQGFIYVRDNQPVKTACLSVIKDADDKNYGFILLFDKKHEPTSKGTYFNNTFYSNNLYITSACSKYLILYRNLEFSNNKRNRLLKKYRHEMPECTEAIDRNIRMIKNEYKNPTFRIRDLEKCANDLLVNCDRIDLLASFFSAIDYDDSRLTINPLHFNLKNYIESKIDVFREEGLSRGVYVRDDIGIDTPTQTVSLFYQLSLTNILINAIRYAAPGTCVWIRSNSEVITISDMGLPVLESEKEKIFKEGYRSPKARQRDQRGMGYGLYLTKKIIEAHGQRIDVECSLEYKGNYFAQASLYETLSTISRDDAEKYIYKENEPSETRQAALLYVQMREGIKQISAGHRDYINKNKEHVQRWIEYIDQHGPFFLDLEEQIFNNDVYHVTFTIYLH